MPAPNGSQNRARQPVIRVSWQQAQATLGEKMARRSIPVSFGEPVMAMIALWYEYREDLPPLIQKFIQSTGCTLMNGASFLFVLARGGAR